MITKETQKLQKGLHFLVEELDSDSIFIPEDFNEEHKMILETSIAFSKNEVDPVLDQIEEQKEGVSVGLMKKLADLGMLGAHMPEEYGGMNLDFISNTIIGQEVGSTGSFSATFLAHIGIGMLPILYFGTKEQKEQYLPKLISGEYIASYCLTEPSSGSDALAAKTTAILSEDKKHYVLNGQKMWITNAGWSDVFIVFAKIDGEHFTCFIVDRDSEGLKFGEEEKKLGIKGSSTRMVFLENVQVPVNNILGEIGKGHLIAFNVLNIGRYKLGASCTGASVKVLNRSIGYAKEREQFNKSISNFGAIKYKLAEQTIRAYTSECVTYRIAGIMQAELNAQKKAGASNTEAKLEAAEEYALECSIIKILGSEVLDYTVDELVQIHGGMGFSEEGMIARSYRDSRINRIFEGTNEINRLLMASILYKRAMKGKFDLSTAAMKVQGELTNTDVKSDLSPILPLENKCVKDLKSLTVMLLGLAGQQSLSGHFKLKEEQEIVMNLADLMIYAYSAESVLGRVLKLKSQGQDTEVEEAILKVMLHDTNNKAYKASLDALADMVDDSMYPMMISGIKKLTKYPIQKVKTLRRKIADKVIEKDGYCFS